VTHPSALDLDPSKGLGPHALPVAAWVLGFSCLAGQPLQLGEVGTKRADDGMALSVALGAVITAWVASGVLRARTVRLVLAAAVLGLGLLGYLIECSGGGADAVFGWTGVQLLVSAVSVASLVWFIRTDYFAWRRSHPRADGPSLAPLLAIAVLVGLLGGVVNTPERAGIWVRVNL